MRKWLTVLMCASLLFGSTSIAFAEDGTPVSGETKMEAEWSEMQNIISKYQGEWTEPTYEGAINDRVPNTAILGNGDVGISSDGSESEKTFHISKGDFWEYNNRPLKAGSITIGTRAGNDGNLATACVKATASSEHDSFLASMAVNGQWREGIGYEGWVSSVGNIQWLLLDMGEAVTFNRWVVRNDGAGRPAETEHNTSDCELQIWNGEGAPTGWEAEGWTTISKVTGNKDNIISITLEEEYTAQYIRLYVTKGTQGTTEDSRQNPRARVGAFELYLADPSAEEEETGTDAVHQPAIAYHEVEDILNAEIRTRQELLGIPMEIKSWMSATNNLFVMEITSLKTEGIDKVQISLDAYVSGGRPTTAKAGEDYVLVTRSTNGANAYDTNSYTSTVAMAARILGADAAYETDGSSSGYMEISLPAGETAYMVTAVTGGGRTYDGKGQLWSGRTEPAEEAITLLNEVATKEKADALHQAHLDWWKEYWLQSYISLDTSDEDLDTLQKYYYAAQYELGSGIRNGNIAAGLYGIWHTNDNASWHSDYHLNYNFISTYYGLASSNRTSMILPAVEALMDYVPQGIKNAGSLEQLRAVYSPFVDELIKRGQVDPVKGIEDAVLFPVSIGPYAMTLEHNSYLRETINAPLSAYMMIEYYNHTLDEEFMEHTLYVYLKYVLNFLEHWMIEEDGKYTLYAGYNEGSWSMNPAVELAAYKNCLKYGIQISEKLGVDAEKRELWQKMYAGMADQPVAENYKGSGKAVMSLAEKEYKDGRWVDMETPVPWDGNCIPLEAVIPGEVYGFYSPDKELETLRNTVDVFSDLGGWTQINNFPKLAAVAVNIRYDCREIVSNLAAAIREQMQKNMMIEDNVHGIEKAGATEAINNMMLLSDQGVIKLFGNWLEDKDAKFVRLRAAGAFVFSAEYDGTEQRIKEGITMYSEMGATATIASPWEEGMIVLDEAGKIVEAAVGTAPNHEEEITYTFDTEKGKTYTLKKAKAADDVKEPGDAEDVTEPGDADDVTNPGAADDTELPVQESGAANGVLWGILIAVVVLAGVGAAAAYFRRKGK